MKIKQPISIMRWKKLRLIILEWIHWIKMVEIAKYRTNHPQIREEDLRMYLKVSTELRISKIY